MKTKLLFWMALAMTVIGMHSAEGSLYYFFAVHLSMLLIGCRLHHREKRGREAAAARPRSARPVRSAARTKPA